MDLRPLGTTGIDVSPLALGTVKLGRQRQVKYPEPFEIPTDEQALGLLDEAGQLGVNLVDTAPAYGISEERLGYLLPRTQRGGAWWRVVSKAGETFDPQADEGRGASSFDFTPEAIRASVHRSLRRLSRSSLECVLIHSDGDDEHIIEHTGALQCLNDLKAQGLVRAVGISTKTPEGASAAMSHSDVLMLTLNARHHDDLPAIGEASRRGVGVLIKKAFASGHAATGSALDAIDAAIPEIARDAISSIVIGTINPAHLRDNARAITTILSKDARSTNG